MDKKIPKAVVFGIFWQVQKDLTLARTTRSVIRGSNSHLGCYSTPLLLQVLLKRKTRNNMLSHIIPCFWQGQKDLNPRPMVLETSTLPTELYPYTTLIIILDLLQFVKRFYDYFHFFYIYSYFQKEFELYDKK